jgi:hypothetical protein
VGERRDRGERGVNGAPWRSGALCVAIMCMLACLGVTGRVWARHVPDVVVLVFVLGGYQHDQGSKESLQDMMVHAGWERRGELAW